jgi:hypothetical protein
VTVPAERLTRWVRGFADRHGPAAAAPTPAGFDLLAVDGSFARVAAASAPVPLPPWPGQGASDVEEQPAPAGPDPEALAAVVAGHLLVERETALLVVRRGGYAAARLRGAQVTASKVGHRYVQGRTAAGGWSQQRFARRRDNQTTELVGAAVQVAARILDLGTDPPPQVLVTGGDRALVDRALADPLLQAVARLPRGPHLPLGDPRADVVRAVPGMLREVRITITETAPEP